MRYIQRTAIWFFIRLTASIMLDQVKSQYLATWPRQPAKTTKNINHLMSIKRLGMCDLNTTLFKEHKLRVKICSGTVVVKNSKETIDAGAIGLRRAVKRETTRVAPLSVVHSFCRPSLCSCCSPKAIEPLALT